MIKRIPKYYLYQIVGWGLLLAVSWVAGIGGIGSCSAVAVSGLLSSHLLRYIIIRYGWLSLPVKKVWARLLAGAMVASIVMGLLQRAYGYLFAGDVYEGFFPKFFAAGVADLLFMIGPWTMIYYLYHYAGRVQQDASKNRRLEMRVKALEASFREPGTDMAGMMDSLQKIKNCIAEDPAECRKEITEFSKLLRQGYLKTS